jgi:hypothetical protein
LHIAFGKHAGKTVEVLVLKDPDYVHWILAQSEPSGPLARIRAEVLRLMAVFDAKALWSFFQVTCHASGSVAARSFLTSV